jgi:hypothetical protein
VGYCLNDPETDPVVPLARNFMRREWWHYSHFLRLLARGEHNWEIWRLGNGDRIHYLYARDHAKWRSVEMAFADMHTAARDVPVLVAIFPLMRTAEWSDYPYRKLHAQVRDAARAVGLEALDLLPAFEQYRPQEVRVSDENPHPSVLGHALAAEALLADLRERHPALFGTAEPGPPPARRCSLPTKTLAWISTEGNSRLAARRHRSCVTL